ncbi:MAG: DUF2877 domain-containing protein [Stellaceae bacterium]
MSALSESATVYRVVQIGVEAQASLAASGGLAHPVTGLEKTGYFLAAGRILFAGDNPDLMHPRAVLLGEAAGVGSLRFDLAPAHLWRSEPPRKIVTAGLAARCRMMCAGLARTETARGFGTLLFGRAPAIPFDLLANHAVTVADGCRRNDPGVVIAAGRRLLGVGIGLTPSGDDFTGAALFGRRILSPGGAWPRSWDEAGRALAREVVVRSHTVSAALFADLAAGRSFALLHALANALIEDAPPETILAAARRLAVVGHSSGWDMLAGLVAGSTGILEQFQDVMDGHERFIV